MKGSDLSQALNELNGVSNVVYDNRLRSPVSVTSSLDSYVTSSAPDDERVYDVLACDFDATYVLKALESVTGVELDLEVYEKEDLTATTVWFSWAKEYLNATCN